MITPPQDEPAPVDDEREAELERRDADHWRDTEVDREPQENE